MPRYLGSYIRKTAKFELTNELKVEYFHHILKDQTLEFYRDQIENKIVTFAKIVVKMSNEFSSNVKMKAIARKLENLDTSQFEEEHKREDNALKEVARQI